MGSEWQILRIEEIAEKIAMGPFGSNIKVDTFVDDGIPVISGGHLHETRLQDGDFKFVTEEHAARLKNSNVYRGDVVFTHAGNIGQVAYIPESSRYERYVISQRQFYLRCNRSKADPAFVTYFFHSPVGKHQLLANASQVGVPSISRPASNLKEIEIALPALKEQRKIASVIGVIDDRIDVLRQTNATLEAIAQALFKSWFVDFDPVRAKAEGREPEGMDAATAALFPDAMVDSELGSIPEGWQPGVLRNVLDMVTNRVTAGSQTENLPYVPIETIASKSITLGAPMSGILARSSLTLFRKNDILFGAMRPYFHKVALAPFDGVTRTTVFVLRATEELRAFALLAASQTTTVEFATAHSHGSTIPYAKWQGSLDRMPLVIPSDSVAIAFSDTVWPMMKMAASNASRQQTLSALRDTLLPRLISGKLRLPEAEREIEAATA